MRLDPHGCSPDTAVKVASLLLSDKPSEAKDTWPNLVIRGFYGVNKSDVLFKKLKNPSRDKTNALAEVLDTRKGDPVTVRILDGAKLNSGMKIEMVCPDGKKKQIELKWIRDLNGNTIEDACENMIVSLPPIGSATCKALIFDINNQ